MVLSLVVAIPLYGLDSLLNIPTVNDLNDPQSIEVLKYFQIIQSIGLFIVPPIILGWLFYGNVSNYLFLNKSFLFSSVLIVLALTVAVAPVINFVGEINNNMQFPNWLAGVERWMKNSEENAALLTQAFLDVDSIAGLSFNLFMVAFLPAIGEELLLEELFNAFLPV